MNQVYLLGNSGSDGELKTTQSNFSVLNLSIATQKKVKEEYKTTWHKVVVLGKLAELVAPQVKKGSKVFVSGELQTREWMDAQGQKRSITEVLARECYILYKELEQKKPTQEGSPFQVNSQEWYGNIQDDVPF